MMSEGENWPIVLEGVRQNEPGAVRQLYQMLYHTCYPGLREAIPDDATIEDAFQDAFLILQERIKLKKLSGQKIGAKAQLIKIFNNIVHRQLYHLDRSVYLVVKGVQQKNPAASNHLIKAVQDDGTKKYVGTLADRFYLRTINQADVLNECTIILLENIRKGKFTVEADHSNALNRNKLFKYFRSILFRWINKWKKQQPVTTDLDAVVQRPTTEVEVITDLKYMPRLQLRAIEMLNNLDEAGKYILRETYFRNKTPREIANTIPFPAYQSTPEVVQKKLDSLNKLKKDLAAALSQMEMSVIKQIQRISKEVMRQLREPCSTILKYALPPLETDYAEIAAILQRTRPETEVRHLKTATQVKKRKYKCLQTMHEKVWGAIINP